MDDLKATMEGIVMWQSWEAKHRLQTQIVRDLIEEVRENCPVCKGEGCVNCCK